MRWILPLVALSLMVTGNAENAFGTPIVRFQFESDPGETIGGGRSFDRYYDRNLGDSVDVYLPQPLGSRSGGIDIWLEGPANEGGASRARISFGTERLGIQLQPGYYPDAQGWPFEEEGHPGIDVSISSTGALRANGAFTIFEVTFSSDGSTLESLIWEFEQRNGNEVAALRGRLEYRASGLVVIPEASTSCLLAVGLVGLAGVRRRRSLLCPRGRDRATRLGSEGSFESPGSETGRRLE